MKNKLLLLFVFTFPVGRTVLIAQTAGITIGAQWQGLYEKSHTQRIATTFNIGYQHAVLDKLCLGAAFNISAIGELSGENSLVKELDNGMNLRYYSFFRNYKNFNFECRYFINDFDDAPAGFYIASSYKFGWFNSINTTQSLTDMNGYSSSGYKQIIVNETYTSKNYINSFGLKAGLMVGPFFNFYSGIDFNFSSLIEDPRILQSNLQLSPKITSTSFVMGVSFGFGLGY
ncbi:MAG: hypothetical protein H7296_13260 [Bacteroidia bacterium]|nr:hypothetical protein [Bacteroidia bacterium]